jgi:hypothetical protein
MRFAFMALAGVLGRLKDDIIYHYGIKTQKGINFKIDSKSISSNEN